MTNANEIQIGDVTGNERDKRYQQVAKVDRRFNMVVRGPKHYQIVSDLTGYVIGDFESLNLATQFLKIANGPNNRSI